MISAPALIALLDEEIVAEYTEIPDKMAAVSQIIQGDTVDGSEILHPSQPSLSIGKTNLNMSPCPICTRNPWCRLHRVILGCSTDR